MKWTFAVLSVLAILSVRKAVPSSLENLFEEIMNMKRNEVSAQAPSFTNILKETLAAKQNEEEAKAAIACLPGPLPICKSFLEPGYCCEQPKELCDVCKYLGYEGCCPPKPPFPVFAKEPESEPKSEPESEVKIAMNDKWVYKLALIPGHFIYNKNYKGLGTNLKAYVDLDEEAMAAVVCQSDPLPLCKSVQSPPFCCIHPPVKCALCKTLGLSPCCPSYPPGVLVLDKKGESGK